MNDKRSGSANGGRVSFAGDTPVSKPASPAADVFEAQDKERARIARELHDSVGQKLAVLQVSLAKIAGALPLEERSPVLEAQDQVSAIAGELHAISHELYPSRLQLLGVARAIDALCRETSRQSGIAITFDGDSTLTDIGRRESLCLYRIVQEAIQNIVKHSHARRASVRLVRGSGVLILTVIDFGRGFDSSRPGNGIGLASMHQRAQLLGGTVSVQTWTDSGTRIRVKIPCAHRHH